MDNHIEDDALETPIKRDKGFTLVELLIVIVILGILATVTVFAVRGISDKGETSACSADKKTLEVAIESWYALPAAGTGARTDAASTSTVGGTSTTFVANDGIPSEADLVATKLMRSVSSKYDVGATGDPVAVAPCT